MGSQRPSPRLASQLAVVALAAGLGGQRAPAAGDGFAAWTASGFSDGEHRWLDAAELYPAGARDLPYGLDATVVFGRDTAWTQARAMRQIRRTAAVFAPCGIRLGRVLLVRLRLGPEARRIDAAAAGPESGVPPVVADLSAKLSAGTPYPVAFLIGRVEGTESLAISYRAHDRDGPPAPYFDTAWIGFRAHWLPRRDDRYSALAHEFAHLLCRCGHKRATASHLLHSARNFLSAAVLPEHCEQFAASPLLAARPDPPADRQGRKEF